MACIIACICWYSHFRCRHVMHTIFRLNIWLPPALNGVRSVKVFLVYFECPVYMNIMWCIPSFGSDSWCHIPWWPRAPGAPGEHLERKWAPGDTWSTWRTPGEEFFRSFLSLFRGRFSDFAVDFFQSNYCIVTFFSLKFQNLWLFFSAEMKSCLIFAKYEQFSGISRWLAAAVLNQIAVEHLESTWR